VKSGHKKKLRQKLKLIRHEYPSALKKNEEKKAVERLGVWIDRYRPQGIHIYLSFGTEFSTLEMVDMIWERSIPLFCPKVAGPKGFLSHHRLLAWEDLERHRLGMLEPRTNFCKSDEMVIDLVLVPGLGFGRAGERLGYGGGYYDRFLNSSPAFKVGLGYGCQLLQDCPVEGHDILMDEVWID
jgi:5-formyltetrahydrofolate cyclo-ligase